MVVEYIAVAEHEQSLSGYVAGACHSTFYAAGWTASVDEILVRPERRGHGIGRMLMEAFEEWALSKNCRLVSRVDRYLGTESWSVRPMRGTCSDWAGIVSDAVQNSLAHATPQFDGACRIQKNQKDR